VLYAASGQCGVQPVGHSASTPPICGVSQARPSLNAFPRRLVAMSNTSMGRVVMLMHAASRAQASMSGRKGVTGVPCIPVSGGKQRCRLFIIAVYRAHSVDHVLCRQVEALGDARLACMHVLTCSCSPKPRSVDEMLRTNAPVGHRTPFVSL
jgi:hypothetical protein